MKFDVNKRVLTVYEDDGTTAFTENEVMFAYETNEYDGLIFFCHEGETQIADLYYLSNKDLKKPILLAKQARIVHYTSDFSKMVLLENYHNYDYANNVKDGGDLILINDLKDKILINTKITNKTVLIFNENDDDFKIIYSKEIQKNPNEVFLPENFYEFGNGENKLLIEGAKDPYLFVKKGNLSIVYMKNVNDDFVGDLYRYENGQEELMSKKTASQFKINKNQTQIAYMNNIKFISHYDRAKCDLVVENLETRKKIILLANQKYYEGNISSALQEFFEDVKYNTLVDINFKRLNRKFKLNILESTIEKYFEEFGEHKSKTFSRRGKVTFYFTRRIGRAFDLAINFAEEFGEHLVINNDFPEDESENHMVSFKKEQIEDIAFFGYVLKPLMSSIENRLYGLSIYDVILESILIQTTEPKGSGIINGKFLRGIIVSPAYRKTVEEAVKKLKLHFQIENDWELNDILEEYNQPFELENDYAYKCLRSNSDKVSFEDLKERRASFTAKLTNEGKLKNKWKSEEALFKLIHGVFVTAVPHASPIWLGRQHLDVYVKEHNLAFEYQGVQHYKPIQFFGGEDNFIKRIELDKRKKQLCEENGVVLVEWHYEEPVTKAVLKKKLNALNIFI